MASQQQQQENISIKSLRIVAIRPLVCICMIIYVTTCTIYCNALFYPESVQKFLNLFSFLGMVSIIMFSLCCVICDGPGYLPLKWSKGDTSQMIFCKKCKGYKAPRSEHCDQCGRCVLKMVNHCKWFNVCIGHYNQRYFLLFLTTVLLASVQSLVIISVGLKNYFTVIVKEVEEDNRPRLSLYFFIFCVGLSAGVALIVKYLLYQQLMIVVRNMTKSESEAFERVRKWKTLINEPCVPWIFNFGPFKNFSKVITLSALPPGNGVDWDTVQEDTDMYWLSTQTMNMIKQQSVPREFSVTRPFKGPKIKVQEGDKVMALGWSDDSVLVQKLPSQNPSNDESAAAQQLASAWIPWKIIEPRQTKSKDD